MIKHFSLLLILGLLSGCVSEAPSKRLGDTVDDATSQGSDDSGEAQTDGTASFYKNGYFTSIAIDSNIDDVLYVRGDSVQTYLSNETLYTGNYCLILNYRDLVVNGVAVNLQLRARAVPISFNNFSTGTTERLLRIELQDKTTNASSCKGAIALTNTNSSTPTSFTEFTSKFLVSELCPDCFGTIASDEVFLYESDGVNLGNQVPTSSIDTAFLNLTGLTLSINSNNNTTNPNTGCTDNGCQAQGFDCCSSGQCVNDGSQKQGVNTSSAPFLAALQEVLAQPSTYTNYPEYFYICAGGSTPAGEDDDGDPITEAQERLVAMLADKDCIDELVNDSTTFPYTLNYFDPTSYPATIDTTKCSLTSTDNMYVQTVMERMYQQCGCSQTTFMNKVNNCPAYKYKILEEDAAGNPLSVGCDAPPVDTGPVPFQELDINVNARSVPHRFFKRADGEAIDDLTPYFLDTSITFEGDDFSYLDGLNRMIPLDQENSMNAILGAFSTTLDQALPAKMLAVETGTSYLIETRSGYFQTCVNCARDSWLNSFTAFPTSNVGVGLKAIGHTASRDEYITNSTGGNYEDTHFGRACWVPPTMLPYTHTTNANSDTQRQNRLKAQAALYTNGYQKDWFGFNKGAIIGSFDGVTWFAIGKGRIVTATTQKLFIAINAPFGDLAENSIHTVGVSQYNPPATAALYDYDPTIPAGPLQNEAASCQKYHQCNVDSDCVTQLGWEYVCADVSRTSMYKPIFSSKANEYDEVTPASRQTNGSKTVTFKKWLFQSTLPGTTSKRCVYRGAGSVCKRDYAEIKNDESKRKLLTCAPNFYCANPDEQVFNSKVVRYVGPLGGLPLGDGNIYGMDADVLGRPQHYISDSSELIALSSDVQANISSNMALNDSTNNWGLCRPGKVLAINELDIQNGEGEYSPLNTHKNPDSMLRTDYINQIGNCNSSQANGWIPTSFYNVDFDPTTWGGSASPAFQTVPPKHYNCPVFDSDGDYLYTKDVFTNLLESATDNDRLFALVEYNLKANRQNSCGGETLDSGGNSPFTSIELGQLDSTQITTPSFAQNACLRRAGSVCHTNLDCTPNKYHANLVNFFSPDYFGNEAELAYWEENLICGQGELVPQLSENDPLRTNDRFDMYDLTKNRCCRELGKDITIYSEDMNDFTFTQNADPNNKDFSTVKLGYEYPTDPARYSRLASVNLQESSPSKGELISNGLSANISTAVTPDNDGLISLIEKYQWRTLSDAASNTCCGGGWVRKFADSTTDWSRSDRLSLNVTNFRCLNYQSPVLLAEDPTNLFGTIAGNTLVDTNSRDGEYNLYCQNEVPDEESSSGCAQVGFEKDALGFNAIAPVLDTNASMVRVIFGETLDRNTFNFQTGSQFFPYQAVPLQGQDFFDGTLDPVNSNWITIAYQLPTYIPADFSAANFALSIVKSDGTLNATCGKRTVGAVDDYIISGPYTGTNSCSFTVPAAADPQSCQYCYFPDSRVIAITHDELGVAAIPEEDAFVSISFTAPGTQRYQTNNSYTYDSLSQKPGNMFYYLKRLGKFELSGIPQMYYEPLYCNDDYQKVVPGLYDDSLTTATEFNTVANAGGDKAFIMPGPDGTPGTADDEQDQRLDAPNNRSVASIVSSAAAIDGGAVATNEGIDHPDIFSSNEFKCCIKLGKNSTSPGLCCSGFSAADTTDIDQDGDMSEVVCKLPTGANLSVYFNRFVSGEGIADNMPNGGLDENEFDPNTGEPLMTSSVYNKLIAIGDKFCEGEATRRGGAFGNYSGEPQSFAGGGAAGGSLVSGVWGIVDSVLDTDAGAGGSGEAKGYDLFTEGYRWNHHVYCTGDGAGP